MVLSQPIQRIINLLAPDRNVFLSDQPERAKVEAEAAVRRGDVTALNEIEGHFAIVQSVDKTVRMARTIGRPMRYFLAKKSSGPVLVIAERIDEIRDWLQAEELENQFHPSYTRMVPAHHILELQLIGCPDPNPTLTRFFSPQPNRLPAQIHEIGQRYIGVLAEQLDRWLATLDPREPIGVLFSGGVDSGALLILLNHLLLKRGQSPARLKAFSLSIDGISEDVRQAMEFCRATGLEMLLEVIDVSADTVDWREAVRIVEDYKPLDVQAATMAIALCRGIRQRYLDWKHLVDGDGGDENLKDYPIEDNPELTIRSVLNNRMLYQEGWGVDAVKHSLVYSGGQSRGHMRTYAPAVAFGFVGFSPYALPKVIEVAEGIPFIELTDWSHEKLYALKGEIISAGIQSLTGTAMPVFEKRRFQHGATSAEHFAALFPSDHATYRQAFSQQFAV